MVVGYYKADPSSPWEKPVKFTKFSEQIESLFLLPQVIDADVFSIGLPCLMQYPNGTKVHTATLLCLKTENGDYEDGFEPSLMLKALLHVLTPVKEE